MTFGIRVNGTCPISACFPAWCRGEFQVVPFQEAFMSNTDVLDKNGNKIGMINSDGMIMDKAGNKIGTLKPDGTVLDKSGCTVGKRNPDGSFVDRNGNLVK